MIEVVAACLAGGLGAVARALVDDATVRRGPAWAGTLLINTAGSFLAGTAAVAAPAVWATVIVTGFCGGFTTFSTACWQAARELGARRIRLGLGYAASTVTCCLTAAAAGLALGGLLV